MEKTIVIMPDDDYQNVKHILWPTSADIEKQTRLTMDRPPVADMQYYYIENLDRSEAQQKNIDSFIATSQQYLFNTLKFDIQRSQTDWFHALLFNYDLCEMNQDLNHAIEFILKKYTPLHVKDMPNGQHEWNFVKQSFEFVLKSHHVPIKTFLLLALTSWAPELSAEIEKMCVRKHFKLIWAGVQRLVEEMIMSPFNRTNICYRIQVFLVQLSNLVCMHIIPGMDATVQNTSKDEPDETFELADQMKYL